MYIDGYEILEKLGEGATSEVYKAVQKSMDRIVAIKVLHPSLSPDENFQKRFLADKTTP